MANMHMERCSLLLIIREMQIKNTMRYHFTSSRTAIIKSLQITNAGKDMGKRETSYPVGRNVSWRSHYGKQYGGSSEN